MEMRSRQEQVYDKTCLLTMTLRPTQYHVYLMAKMCHHALTDQHIDRLIDATLIPQEDLHDS